MRIGRRLRLVGLGAAVAFGALQLFRPAIEPRATRAEMAMPAAVAATLRRSCFDCHSNETKLAWFDHVAPGSWLVARDVRRARAVLNFSELGPRPRGEQRARIFEAIEMMAADAMPPGPYRALHAGVSVSEPELGAIKAFAATLAEPALEPKIVGVTLGALASIAVPPAPNGLPFPEDVATWTPLEMSERWDNGTVRLVLGNQVAAQAAKQEHRARWPDGASLAKVAWRPGVDVEHSSFVQIEVMRKDGATWRWARWLGEALTPFGQDASFDEECKGCHEPMRESDLVYSLPETPIDPSWGKVTSLRVERGRFHVVTTAADGRARAMSWAQRDDPNWFGARISTGPSSPDTMVDLNPDTPRR